MIQSCIPVYRIFEKIVSENYKGENVLEVGTLPDTSSLLNMSILSSVRKKIGINLVTSGVYKDFEVIKCNANNMHIFQAESFDLVLSNATLEHDKYFWKSVSEMRRVLKKNGLMIIGVPTYSIVGGIWDKIGKIRFSPEVFQYATFTSRLHRSLGVGDYYRFSEESIREVFFEGFNNILTLELLSPPRIIGWGFRD